MKTNKSATCCMLLNIQLLRENFSVMEKKAFDSFLGGEVNLAPEVLIKDFGQHRIDEILMLAEAINEPPNKGQLFQRLPKHMRRRQMSHHESRLPRRLRLPVPSDNKDAPPKRPSRKYRRKPRNLLLAYNRRQRDKVWLETHIWHAKRFHMVSKWGYRLGRQPTNKGFRANYRATAKHCLALDLSYYNCIELIGTEENLLSGLSSCTNQACGLTFAAKSVIDGSRQGITSLFHPSCYPFGAIGEVSFLWKPVDIAESQRQLWIWTHPAVHSEVVECFQKVFHLSKGDDDEAVGLATADTKEKAKLATKTVPFSRIPHYKSQTVQMNLLKDTLNRFRLIGPLSSSVLSTAFSLAPLPENDVVEIPVKRARIDESNDFEDHCAIDEVSQLAATYNRHGWGECWEKQKEAFEKFRSMTSPTQIPPSSVLSLLVVDPRLTRPNMRTKSRPSDEENCFINNWSPLLAVSAIWSNAIRDAITAGKPSTWDLDRARAERVVRCEQEKGVAVPLLVIQRPGCRGPNNSGYGSGFDIICPAGWGLPVWQGLILRGARAGGLKDIDGVCLESRSLSETLQPDSNSGRLQALEQYETKKTRYKSLPPAKRPNFNKLGIPSPFLPLWNDLAQYWSQDRTKKDVYVLREVAILRKLSETVEKCLSLNLTDLSVQNIADSIVPIAVTCKTGRPDQLAHLYLPTAEDLCRYKKGEKAELEPQHKDIRKNDRKEVIKAHKKEIRSQKRQRKKERKALDEEIRNQPLVSKLPEGFATKLKTKSRRNEVWEEKVADLWLPEKEKAIELISESSRRLAGYALYADFSFTHTRGSGLGYITLPALMEMVRICSENGSRCVLLLRNTDQYQFRSATVNVVLD